ncbi:maternal protein exuperantia-like [Lutzomyia longipalpis]|uniref:maternal protein exuperantia-like n=1 Tax=Lutzomyia longipalpis TaxID=7200 RepID=UPI0024843611|nr:maternal protein exuperantia-like [Lutzomyia longipalpis]
MPVVKEQRRSEQLSSIMLSRAGRRQLRRTSRNWDYSLFHRVRSITFQRFLAEQGFDMTKFQDIWGKDKRDGIKVAVAGLRELMEDDKKDLMDLLDCHFDPEKQIIKPVSRKTNKRRFQKRQTSRISSREIFKK